MKGEKYFFVYIATNYPRCSVLYTGITNNLNEREYQHKTKLNSASFSGKYNVNRIVYYETFEESYAAISREKQIKKGSRQKKLELINNLNPKWEAIIDW